MWLTFKEKDCTESKVWLWCPWETSRTNFDNGNANEETRMVIQRHALHCCKTFRSTCIFLETHGNPLPQLSYCEWACECFFLVSTFFSIGASIVDLEKGYLVNKYLQDIQEMNIDKSTIEAMKIIKTFLDLKLRAEAYKYKQRSHWFP